MICDKRKRIWIAWEKQRRTLELAASFGCELFVLEHQGRLRYLRCVFDTFRIIKSQKPSVLFVQNPSILLACFSTCFIKYIFKIPVIVDRHTNFLLANRDRFILTEAVFHFFSYLSIRFADLTIVTNEDLSHIIYLLGGRPFVLTDKIPDFKSVKINKEHSDNRNPSFLFITSFAADEPINEFIEGCSKLEDKGLTFYVSGNYNKLGANKINQIPRCIKLTGFVSETDFVRLLFSVDIVIVLTTCEYTLLCGCYEALAANKILITTRTNVLKKVFSEAIFVDNTPDSIVDGIQRALKELHSNHMNTQIMKNNIIKEWNSAKIKLDDLILKLENIERI
ncbi:MAG: glycosyltransferase [Proteobacteria bacterium]|nr:glycosyltransferase [Pseudomonadota bacterium]MBU1544357.1 glycosyltransferase [Pseudomonadota bacterium]